MPAGRPELLRRIRRYGLRTPRPQGSGRAYSRAPRGLFPPGRFGSPLSLASAVFLLGLLLLPFPLLGQDGLPDFDAEWRWADFDRDAGYQGHWVRHMLEVGDTLWVLADGGISWFAGFHWHQMGVEDGLPEGLPSSMASLEDGTLVVAIDGRVYAGNTTGFRPFHPEAWNPDDHHVASLAATPLGIMVRTFGDRDQEDRLFLWTDDGPRELDPPGTLRVARGLWPSPDGAVWLAVDQGLVRFQRGEWITVVGPGTPNHQFSGVWEAPDGSGFASQVGPLADRGLLLWEERGRVRRMAGEGENIVLSGVTTHDGLRILLYETGDIRVLSEDGWETPVFSAIRREGLHYVFEDHLGDLWFATRRGLHLFRRSLDRWTSIRFPFPDPRNRVNDILVESTGEVWLATHGGIGRMASDGSVEWIREILGQETTGVTSLTEDPDGNIWASSGGAFDGAYRFRDGIWEAVGPDQGGPPGRIHRIARGRDGSLWFASLGSEIDGAGAGAYRLTDGELERWMDDRGWLSERTYSIAEAPDGSIWFGSLNGLVRWKEGDWSYWGPEDGVGVARVARAFTVLPDSLGGALVGSGPSSRAGLARILPDGSVEDLGPAAGLSSAAVNEIARDPDGAIWISSGRGVAHTVSGQWTLLDGTVGLNPAGSWPLAFREGEVLIGTTGGGLQILDLGEEKNPPPVVRVSDPVNIQGSRFRLHFSVASFRGQLRQDAIQVRHRVQDGPWSAWGTYRDIESGEGDGRRYGETTVQIQAKDPFSGVSTPVSVSFVLQPPLFLRPLFVASVALLGLLALTTLWLGRQRKRRAEAAIRESESTLRTLVESAPDGIAIYDADRDQFTDVNANVLTLTGMTREEFLSTSLGGTSPEILPDGSSGREFLLEKVEQALAGESVTFEWFSRERDGPHIPVEMRLVRLPSEKGRLVRFSVLDIRDRREAEEKRRELEGQLRQSQKLEAVGQLTGGVAHDFNNLLTVILGNLDLLKEIRDHEEDTLELIDGAIDAAERSSLLTQRLLAFSRRQALDSKPVLVSDLVTGILGLLERSLGETIKIHADFPSDLWVAQADPGQLEHAMVNLAVNARDAMQTGGDLFLEATNVRVEPEAAEKWGGHAGEYVCLSVTDTGAGMEPKVRERAIDPFFTTKEVGAGSGLGLSMVYGFVKQSGGFIKIHSELGRGTAVQLFLPRSTEAVQDREGVEADRGETPVGSGEVILIVEDEPLLLKLTTTLCQKLGYEAVGASVARGALDFLLSGKDVDLLFTDVVLPGGMDGIHLALEARALRPHLPVLLTTGYAEQSVWRLTRDLSNYDLITKPFDTETLARKIRAMLSDQEA